MQRATEIRWTKPYGPSDRLLSLTNMDFCTTKQRLLEAVAMRATVWLPVEKPADLRAAALAGKFTVLVATVLHIEKLLEQVPEGAIEWLAPLTAIYMGGSTVSDRLRGRIRKRLCPRLFVRYATNETQTLSLTSLDDVYDVPGGVGRPISPHDLEIVDEAGNPVEHGKIGHIRARGPKCIDGYLNDPEATARAFRDGWYYPGDLGRMTQEGILVHLGRADDLMIVDGINIYPAEVEQVLALHPDVLDARALALPHPAHQDVPVALVAVTPGSKVTDRALLDFVGNRIGPHALHRAFLTDELPRNLL
jgi:acyl-CoA synthetase (AMP-forming)/AMP-acid ligase II